MDITGLLRKAGSGDEEAQQKIMPALYTELKKLAAGHLKNDWPVTLSATGLVHEAYLRMAGSVSPDFENRSHFFGIASRIMRNVLVDMVRHDKAQKRGSGLVVHLEDFGDVGAKRPEHLLDLDDALRRLAESHPRPAEVIEMRFFGGMTVEECAVALGVSAVTVRRQLRFGQAWLQRELEKKSEG